jgi:hypothetical protein
MIKKALATAAAAASIVGVAAAAASPAMATGKHHDGGKHHGGKHHGTTSVNGNGTTQLYGNSTTKGYMSPQIGLIQGSLNKPCVALPYKANFGSLFGAFPTTIQDINVLANPQSQQCAENSTQAKGDEALSHILNDIPILSGNGGGKKRH